MKKVKGITVFLAAMALTFLIVLLQFAWNLTADNYLVSMAERTRISSAIAKTLPEYATTKLPNEEATRKVFTQYVTPQAINESIKSLAISTADAYKGKTDVVEIDITSITTPVRASGYQIPPGTVFASDTIQVGGLASVLRTISKLLVPTFLITLGLFAVVLLVGIKSGPFVSLRNVLLVTCLLLAGLVLAALLAPILISSVPAVNITSKPSSR